MQISSLSPFTSVSKRISAPFDLICFSSSPCVKEKQILLQHLLHCCAQIRRVFFIEDFLFKHYPTAPIKKQEDSHLWINAVPVVSPDLPSSEVEISRKHWLDQLFAEYGIQQYLLWYTHPSTLTWTDHLEPLGIIYDYNALSLPELPVPTTVAGLQHELLTYADLVLCSNKTLAMVGQRFRQMQVAPSYQTGPAYISPTCLLIEPPDGEEQQASYWKDAWNIISTIMNILATERYDWPFYALSSLKKCDENNPLQDNR